MNLNYNLLVVLNLLNQMFVFIALNQVWVVDLMYVVIQEGWLYFVGIKDVYMCEIVGYVMGECMIKELIGKVLFMVFRSQCLFVGLIYYFD